MTPRGGVTAGFDRSSAMPSAFDFEHSPFDCLTPEERERVRAQVDIAYFREGEAILEAGMAPTHLFIVIKGFVRQFSPGDSEPYI